MLQVSPPVGTGAILLEMLVKKIVQKLAEELLPVLATTSTYSSILVGSCCESLSHEQNVLAVTQRQMFIDTNPFLAVRGAVMNKNQAAPCTLSVQTPFVQMSTMCIGRSRALVTVKILSLDLL